MLVDDAINHAIHPVLKCKQTADINVNKVTSIKNDLYAHFMEKLQFLFFTKIDFQILTELPVQVELQPAITRAHLM